MLDLGGDNFGFAFRATCNAGAFIAYRYGYRHILLGITYLGATRNFAPLKFNFDF